MQKSKDILEAIAHLATIGAIVVGAIWTYLLFIQNREIEDKLIVSLSAQSVRINDELNWIRVDANLKNVGKTKTAIVEGGTRLQLINPLDRNMRSQIKNNSSLIKNNRLVVDWPTVDERKLPQSYEFFLEPGESAKLPFEFVVPIALKVFKVYSYFRREKGSRVVWDDTIVYKIETATAPLEK